MSALYFVFAIIPLLTVAAAYLPEITGWREAVPADGFEYTLRPPKKRLILGGFGIFLFGVLLCAAIDYREISSFPESALLFTVFAALIGELFSLFSVVYYFGYRITVRGGTLICKIPLKKEILLALAEADSYTEQKNKNGISCLVIRFGKRRLFVEGAGCDLLSAELHARGIKKIDKNKGSGENKA